MKLSNSFEVLNLDDEWIAVPIGDDSGIFKGVLKLNEEGATIIKCLAYDTTEDKIADEMLKEYDTTREKILTEIHSFVEQLRCNGLITE